MRKETYKYMHECTNAV